MAAKQKTPQSTERGLRALYQDDPDRADALIFGRRSTISRRGFLRGAGLAAMSATVGAAIPYAANMPMGLIPAALADDADWVAILASDGLTVLNDRPINVETPAWLLDDDITPNHRHFVRNNGLPPEPTDAGAWTLTVEGEVNTPLVLTIDDLRNRFEVVELALQLECGGNGRAGFNPPARGNQWTVGAIGNARWTGIRYADLLAAAGIKDSAIYTGHYSTDVHLSGDPNKVVISRGLPIAKAMQPNTLIAFAMNGEPIPMLHGAPLRVVAPGWPGSTSQKWLNRILIRNQVHDGPKMTGMSYRVPAFPVPPGAEVAKSDMRIIENMPVKSLITRPKSGVRHAGSGPLAVRGHAWAGDRAISHVHLSIDYGATWIKADLKPAANRGSWQNWTAAITFPIHGYYEVWSRATDDAGVSQPMTVPGWNPRGYLNNVAHRIAVTVT